MRFSNMDLTAKDKLFKFSMMGICSVFFLWWGYDYMYKDLSWDEIATLSGFAMKPLKYTLTNYPDVNDHVLLSILYNGITELFGIREIYGWFDKVHILRLTQYVFSIITLIYVFRFAKKFLGGHADVLGVLFLITCVPFLNWAMQIRGYNLSGLFSVMSVYYAVSYINVPGKRSYWLFVVSVFLNLYTLPSDLYFIVSLAITLIICWFTSIYVKNRELKKLSVKERKRTNFEDWHHISKNDYFKLLTAFVPAAIITFLAYYPILDQVREAIVAKRGSSFLSSTFSYQILKDVLPFTLNAFISYKYLLIIPLIYGFWLFRQNSNGKLNSTLVLKPHIFFLLLLILSFLVPFFRGEVPYDRSFLFLCPIFALFMAIVVNKTLDKLNNKKYLQYSVVFIIIAYSFSSYFILNNKIQNGLKEDITSGVKTYNILSNFYQSKYYKHSDLQPLIQKVLTDSLPILFYNEIDRLAMGEYLHKHNLRFYSTIWAKNKTFNKNNTMISGFQVLFEISQGKGNKSKYPSFMFDSRNNNDSRIFSPLYNYLQHIGTIRKEDVKFYVVTGTPNVFEALLVKYHPELKFVKMNDDISYHNIYFISSAANKTQKG